MPSIYYLLKLFIIYRIFHKKKLFFIFIMGNINSNYNNDIEKLKQLYSMNVLELESLTRQLNDQRNKNKQNTDNYKTIINNLLLTQNNIKNKIPTSQFDKVNDFLNNVNKDIHSSEYNIKSWKAGDTYTQPQQTYNSPQPQQTYNSSQPQQTYNSPQPQQTYNSPQPQQTYNLPQPQQTYNPPQPQQTYNPPRQSTNDIKIDPYKLYGFTKNQPIDINQLKEKYKTYALQTHPDRNNGNTKNFNIINEAYKFLVEEYKRIQDDKQFNQLKSESSKYLEQQSKKNTQNVQVSSENFNLNKFNNVFQDNLIENTADSGYSDWINNNKYESEDIQRNNNLSTSNFNDTFNNTVKYTNQVVKYKEPEVLHSRTSNVVELGIDKVDNYSGETNSIKYTDYKEAHTTSRIVDPNQKYREYNSIDQLQNERSNIKELTQEEIEYTENQKSNRDREERNREENQRMMDRLYSQQHDKLHNIMINRQ